MFIVPGQWRATWVIWTPAWEFLGWYVNLEEPFRRTPLGFDVRDLQLDILVDTERKWRWKDEDELEGSVERGLISEAVARRARAEGAAAIADIERGAWPFTDDMRDWRPDPAWPIPTLAEHARRGGRGHPRRTPLDQPQPPPACSALRTRQAEPTRRDDVAVHLAGAASDRVARPRQRPALHATLQGHVRTAPVRADPPCRARASPSGPSAAGAPYRIPSRSTPRSSG